MPNDRPKSRRRKSALRCFMFATAVMAVGGASAFAQSSATSNANSNLTPEARPAGKVVIPPQFDDAWPFSEGLARVKQSGKWGFIDATGALVIAPSYEDAESFSAGRAAVKQDGKWGFVDYAGKTVVAPQFQDARSFSEGLAAVKTKGKWGYIDTVGTVAIAPEFKSARSFTEGLAAVSVTWGLGAIKWNYIDKAGKIAIETKGDRGFDFAAEFSEGLALACNGADCRFINKTGKFVTQTYPRGFVKFWSFSEGLARVEMRVRSGQLKSGFIDANGKVVISAEFGFRAYLDEYLPPREDDAVGGGHGGTLEAYTSDRSGVQITLPALTRKYTFSGGLAAVVQDGRWGFIDKTGKMVIPARWHAAYRFSEGVALVMLVEHPEVMNNWAVKGATYGYIDKTGTMVIGPYRTQEYWRTAKLKEFASGSVPVVIDGKWGYASRD